MWINGESPADITLVGGLDFSKTSNTYYRLLKPLHIVFEWKERKRKNWMNKRIELDIPVGFSWDGASIPKILQPMIGVHDKAVTAGLPHYPESRMFYELLKTRSGKLNIPRWKEKAMYAAVYLWSVFS